MFWAPPARHGSLLDSAARGAVHEFVYLIYMRYFIFLIFICLRVKLVLMKLVEVKLVAIAI